MESAEIRLLAPTGNARGDLFTRLIKDLFFALGYDDLLLDVQKTGREVDIQGKHRLEDRRVVAECKAHSSKIGGADLNKFLGVLTRERDRHEPTPVAGYFLSLSGFSGPGIEQESSTSSKRQMILLDSQAIIKELERAHVLVNSAEAAERAGRCAEHAGLKNAIYDGTELLGHEQGYIRAVFYSKGKERTDFVLVHADGTPLARSVAAEVIAADQLCGGTLYCIRSLAPDPRPSQDAFLDTAMERYRLWIAQECGYIQLDGLPTDADLSNKRLKLEHIFVPLRVVGRQRRAKKTGFVPEDTGKEVPARPEYFGQLLSDEHHLALVAAPGGGKSTLLKWLALAYAFPNHRLDPSETLPDRDWIPILLRCRALRDRAYRPILELLEELPHHSGMIAEEAGAFHEFLREAVRVGRVLLLIDGLDEIHEEGARRALAQNLRTFLAMFPEVAVVVTSRVVGFRLVAGTLRGACVRAELAPFDRDDIQRLCVQWQVEVLGDKETVRADALDLAATILGDRRIRSLAENPLLLTTLLVVRRWIGELPRSRTGLYEETVRVLIRTWNVEGFTTLDQDETLAQLSYVACAMMEEGAPQISRPELLKLLRKARQELEAELQFTQISPSAFINRIEYRSSLIMQTGVETLNDGLQAVYEFRHLTIQAYLAARGYVKEEYPGRNRGESLSSLLEPHFEETSWHEVIALSSVLAGRKAEEIVTKLTDASAQYSLAGTAQKPCVKLLQQCLLDEVRVAGSILYGALRQVARHSNSASYDFLKGLRLGKFGTLYLRVTEECYIGGQSNWVDFRLAFSELSIRGFSDKNRNRSPEDKIRQLNKLLFCDDRLERVRAAFVCAKFALSGGLSEGPEFAYLLSNIEELHQGLQRMLSPDDLPSALPATEALVWLGVYATGSDPPNASLVLALFHLWRNAENDMVATYAAWALSSQAVLPRDSFECDSWGDCDAFLLQAEKQGLKFEAALLVGWYRRSPWSDSEIKDHLEKMEDLFNASSREVLSMLQAGSPNCGQPLAR